MGNLIGNVTGWSFLQEPAWRWFIFVAMILAFLIVQGAILRHL